MRIEGILSKERKRLKRLNSNKEEEGNDKVKEIELENKRETLNYYI